MEAQIDDGVDAYYSERKDSLEDLCSSLMDAVIRARADHPAQCMMGALLGSNMMSNDHLESTLTDVAWRSSRMRLEAAMAQPLWAEGAPEMPLIAQRAHDAVRTTCRRLLEGQPDHHFESSVKHSADLWRQIERWPSELARLRGALTDTELHLRPFETGGWPLQQQSTSLRGNGGSGRIIGAQAVLCLNVRLRRLVLLGVPLQHDADAFAIWAAIAARAAPTQLVIGYHGMPPEVAEYWASAFDMLRAEDCGLEIVDERGRVRSSAKHIQDAFESAPQPWIEPQLLSCLLSLPSSEAPEATCGLQRQGSILSSDGSLKPDKFKSEPVEMVFDNESAFKDGIYGLYKKRGLDPDRLRRSMREEFAQNEGGRWMAEYRYVVEETSREQYPSTKGEAPSHEQVPWYTRERGRPPMTLEDFWEAQPLKGMESELTRAEVAALRLYTGPIFESWNLWLRYGTPRSRDRVPLAEHRVDWSTSLAVLYNAIIKLSYASSSQTQVLFRGIREDTARLPASFLPDAQGQIGRSKSGLSHLFAGGVEMAFLSATKNPTTAMQYTGTSATVGSIFQLNVNFGSRGSSVSWVSQYPDEDEFLFPPCTSLACDNVQQIGSKRVLQISVNVSTRRPDVSWCKMTTDVPPENAPTLPRELGPFTIRSLSMEHFECSAYGRWARSLHVASDHVVWSIGGFVLSPIEKVSLASPEELKSAGIPPYASHYAFVYPLNGEDELQKAADVRDDNLRALTMVGGFVYFEELAEREEGDDATVADSELRILQVNVLAKSDGRGLNFDGPRVFGDEHDVARPKESERHNVTLPSLLECGVQQFAWMPRVGPHGAFGYFYADSSFDCYFLLNEVRADPDDPSMLVQRRRSMSRTSATFRRAHFKHDLSLIVKRLQKPGVIQNRHLP